MKPDYYHVTKKTSVITDRFRNRIMFPLKNAQGRIVGYSGRTYTGQEPKYLNSPETPIFQKESCYIT